MEEHEVRAADVAQEGEAAQAAQAPETAQVAETAQAIVVEEGGAVGTYGDEDALVSLVARFRPVICVALAVLALVSLVLLRPHFTEPATYSSVIETIDEKKANVTGMVASSTALSAAISAIPDDVGTPLANKLMDVSADLGIILSVLYLEKYLLTIFGLVVFGGLLPICCVLLIGAVLGWGKTALAPSCVRLAARLFLLGVVLMTVVPASVAVTNMIDGTYEDSLAPISETAEEEPAEAAGESEEPFNLLDFVVSIPETVVDGVTGVTDAVVEQVNAIIEGLAVMIVTSCLIPVLVLLFFLWVANMLLGLDVSAPMGALAARGRRLRTGWGDAARATKEGLKKR